MCRSCRNGKEKKKKGRSSFAFRAYEQRRWTALLGILLGLGNGVRRRKTGLAKIAEVPT